MGALRSVTVALIATLLGSCAALTPDPAAQSRCGNPCAAVSCPSAFRCDVDAQCTARCQPEVAPKR